MNEKLLAQVPEEIHAQIIDTLKAFPRVRIYFEYGRYTATTSISIRRTYGADHRFVAQIDADELFTPEEETINYVESFRDYPITYKGKRDYQALKQMTANSKVQMVDGNIEIIL